MAKWSGDEISSRDVPLDHMTFKSSDKTTNLKRSLQYYATRTSFNSMLYDQLLALKSYHLMCM